MRVVEAFMTFNVYLHDVEKY